MKTVKKVVLIVLLILLILVVAVGIWQKDNIKSFINSIIYSDQEIAQKLEENAKKMDKIIEETEYIDIRTGGFTDEEEAAIASGEITKEEAKKILKGKTTLEELREKKKPTESDDKKKPDSQNSETTSTKPTEPEKNDSSKEPADKEPEKPPQEDKMTKEVSDIVAELYVIQADFINKLETIGQQMYYEYTEITNYDRSQISSIIDKNLPTVGKLERECDTKINNLLTKLEEALKDGGGDLSLVDEIRNYYYEEKSLKKTYYFDQITIGTSD